MPLSWNEKIKINWIFIAKVFLIILFLPIAAIWYIWKKTNWPKRNKWIATIAVIILTLFIFGLDNSANEKDKEAAALKARVDALENKLNQETQKNITEKTENAEPITESVTETANEVAPSDLYAIISVTDGDTIKANINNNLETVRLIGIDTPETVDPRKPVQCFGKESSDKAKEILTDKKVRLEADGTQGDKDQYGRLLRYVFLEDGTFFNKKMIEDGYAHEYTFESNPYKYQNEFKDAENSARENKRGLWASDTCNGDTTKTAVTGAVAQTVESSAAVVTSQADTGTSASGVVKKSSTGICHAPGTTYYAKTQNFIPFNSIDACLNSGGRLPKR